MDTKSVIKWASNTFGKDIGMFTGFGYGGIVLMDILKESEIFIDVYFIDTGFHFPETLEIARMYPNVKWIRLDDRIKKTFLDSILTDRPWEFDNNLCCHYFKIDPMLRVLPEKKIWMDALRSEQTEFRKNLSFQEIDGRGILKIHPMLDWTVEDCWKYIKRRKLKYNRLHGQNYMSIGCKYCTEPIQPGDHERSGRWKEALKCECGMHI